MQAEVTSEFIVCIGLNTCDNPLKSSKLKILNYNLLIAYKVPLYYNVIVNQSYRYSRSLG